MLKMAVQRGRSERRDESYSVPYVEPLSDARTKLADFFSILLGPHRAPSRHRSCCPRVCGGLHALNAEEPLHCVQSSSSGAGRRRNDRRRRIAQNIAVELAGRYCLCVEIASTLACEFNRMAGDLFVFHGKFKGV